jgi:KTSC domain
MKLHPLPALKAPFNTAHPLPADPVKSSNVKSIAYDPEKHLLQVAFHSGATYDYLGVPPAVHAQLMVAPSKGSFVREAVATRFRAIKRAPAPHA